MTANELADSLMGWAEDVYGGGETLIEAAFMLRHQQAVIETLREQLRYIESLAYGGSTK